MLKILSILACVRLVTTFPGVYLDIDVDDPLAPPRGAVVGTLDPTSATVVAVPAPPAAEDAVSFSLSFLFHLNDDMFIFFLVYSRQNTLW